VSLLVSFFGSREGGAGAELKGETEGWENWEIRGIRNCWTEDWTF